MEDNTYYPKNPFYINNMEQMMNNMHINMNYANNMNNPNLNNTNMNGGVNNPNMVDPNMNNMMNMFYMMQNLYFNSPWNMPFRPCVSSSPLSSSLGQRISPKERHHPCHKIRITRKSPTRGGN